MLSFLMRPKGGRDEKNKMKRTFSLSVDLSFVMLYNTLDTMILV